VGKIKPFEAAPRTRLSDHVAEQLLATIQERGLRAGDQLPTERALSEQFGVSRTVVREAVRSLAGKGIIEPRAGRGLRVATVTPSSVWQSMSLAVGPEDSLDFRKVHEVRAMLEVEIAGRAAERASKAEIAAMRETCDHMALVLEETEEVSIVDVAFHRAVAQGAHNEFFDLILEALADPLLEIRRVTFNLHHRSQRALDQHLEVLAAIEAGDVAEARLAMAAHLAEVEEAWAKVEGDRSTTPLT
jgi:GntR family transcriptional regulator, transcriptional repressor for pyruvate dehydrogenase complex